jgi:hypothetical protein
MVIVHLKGGLGNQLFQYAYGKALMETGVEVIFDTSFFYKENSYTKRLLSLDKFNIPSETHFRNVESKQIYWKRILNKIDSDRRVRFVKMEKYKKSGVADGDYVSEKYFSTIRKKLLQEITLKEESPLFLKYKKQILESKNPTIVHARRTDYLASTGFTQLSVEYYKDGRMMIEDQATLFCFSDDPDWVKTLFPSEEVVIVSGNGLTDYEELMIMS